jgi:hypothetical protein
MTNAPTAKNSPDNEGCSRGAESDYRNEGSSTGARRASPEIV